ncbi:hypothetical protein L7F22_009882 [Adiantum nelumboides]|nr:hypothetical protein [Adiantum nelumboides]
MKSTIVTNVETVQVKDYGNGDVLAHDHTYKRMQYLRARSHDIKSPDVKAPSSPLSPFLKASTSNAENIQQAPIYDAQPNYNGRARDVLTPVYHKKQNGDGTVSFNRHKSLDGRQHHLQHRVDRRDENYFTINDVSIHPHTTPHIAVASCLELPLQ